MDLKRTFIGLMPDRAVPLGMNGALALRSMLYRGRRFSCPCCGRSYRRFLPHGARYGTQLRDQVRCPGCNSFERHRLLWHYLQARTNLFTERLRVLHFAPEYSLQRRLRELRNLDYRAADLESPLADEHFDICSIPYPAESFDVVLCCHVLEHIPDDRKAMSEIRRVLRPDGWAILQVPIDRSREDTFEDPTITTPEARELAYGRHDHVRLYGTDYLKRLERAGFLVDAIPYFEELPAERVRSECLRREEDIYHCRRGFLPPDGAAPR